jgi:heme exporter protein C
MMSGPTKIFLLAYTLAALASLGAAIGVLVFYTPEEASMGPIQKIFYLHMPMAISTLLACMVVFIGSMGYLLQRKRWWDDLAASSAKVAVLLCTGVLITGMIWGKSAWGDWWLWTPRLTFSLMLWLLYVVYLVVRNSIDSPQRRAVVSGVYGMCAFIDVPLVWLSARLIPDVHPASISLSGEMRFTLMLWFVAVTLMAAGLIMARYGLYRLQRRQDEAMDRGFEVVAAGVGGGVA